MNNITINDIKLTGDYDTDIRNLKKAMEQLMLELHTAIAVINTKLEAVDGV